MTIAEFIQRCDAFCATHEVSRVWLSKRLLANTDRLEKLAVGKVDIGVKRLERAMADLRALETERDAGREPHPGAAA
jgi:hypothetical protein